MMAGPQAGGPTGTLQDAGAAGPTALQPSWRPAARDADHPGSGAPKGPGGEGVPAPQGQQKSHRSTSVTSADTTIEPRQPSRLEKTNIARAMLVGCRTNGVCAVAVSGAGR